MIHEYIIQVDDTDRSLDFAFVGQIRRTCKQLVRCKDCKHWDGDSCHVDVWNSEDADAVILDRYADDYCSRAEEKEE